MGRYIALYVITLVVFIAADFLWLGFIAKNFYQQSLGHLMLEKPYLPAAIVFYLLYPIGLVVFASASGVDGGNVLLATAYAALFGLIAYATYDLSNLATLRGVPVVFAAVDIVWGGFASGAASAIAMLATRAFVR